MPRPVRIGNAHGFWGDRLSAASEMLAMEPDLDFLTLDLLAEVSMSILAVQWSRDPAAGWPRDLLEIIQSIAPYWRRGGRCRIITNAGGLNPLGCARACQEVLQNAGCGGRTIAVVAGDNVLDLIQSGNVNSECVRNLDTGQPIADVQNRLVTANAYLGAEPVAAALAAGADLVITGRVADPSLTVAPCAHWFGWAWDDWNRLAGATVAGHLIECGAQVTGGIATDWLAVPDIARIGFPIVEVAEDGSCVVTKPRGTGGQVSLPIVKEQLLYEIGDPDAYLSPDVTASFLSLRVEEEAGDRIRVTGARGRSWSPTYKVSATYQDGFWAQAALTVYGTDAVRKAQRAGQTVLERLKAQGISLRESIVECLGAGVCRPQGIDPVMAAQLRETVLRIAVADNSRAAVERFTRELMPLVTAGPPGTTGYAEGRPRVHPLFRFWPCLIPRDQVKPEISILEVQPSGVAEVVGATGFASAAGSCSANPENTETPEALAEPVALAKAPAEPVAPGYELGGNRPQRLCDIAHARSGDKGIHANIGVIVRRPGDYPRLCRELTAPRVAAYLGLSDETRIARYELPSLGAVNLVIRAILANPLRADAQGKALAQVLLDMPLAPPPAEKIPGEKQP
jgi:hypothetical protein